MSRPSREVRHERLRSSIDSSSRRAGSRGHRSFAPWGEHQIGRRPRDWPAGPGANLADDVESARAALEGANIRFEEGEVITVLLENRAGELAAVSAKLADAGVNLRGLYLTGIVDDLVELAIIADDPKKAKRALE